MRLFAAVSVICFLLLCVKLSSCQSNNARFDENINKYSELLKKIFRLQHAEIIDSQPAILVHEVHETEAPPQHAPEVGGKSPGTNGTDSGICTDAVKCLQGPPG